VKPEHEAILVEALRRTSRHARARRPPVWQTWAREIFDAVSAHGPEYHPSRWFGLLHEHEVKRYRRAIADLEREGLLSTWARWGRRLSHLRLTSEGEKVARELLGAARLERRKVRAEAQPEAVTDAC